jgi:hypothetical protein
MDRKVSPVLFAMPVLLLLVLAPGSYGSAAIITRDVKPYRF